MKDKPSNKSGTPIPKTVVMNLLSKKEPETILDNHGLSKLLGQIKDYNFRESHRSAMEVTPSSKKNLSKNDHQREEFIQELLEQRPKTSLPKIAIIRILPEEEPKKIHKSHNKHILGPTKNNRFHESQRSDIVATLSSKNHLSETNY